ncbi:MAG: alpha/beta hydrolase [Ruminococcus sp.]|nr:alpha/beta hydrolase [Ruminococcus sp.]
MAGITFCTVKADGFTMDMFRFGSGRKPFVILPGLSIRSVMSFAEDVAAAYSPLAEEHTVYLFERRNELPEVYTVGDMARDTAEVFRQLGLKDISLFGASQGGMMAMSIAADYPQLVSKLILASACSRMTTVRFSAVDEWISFAKAGKTAELFSAFGKAVYPEAVFESLRGTLAEAAKTVTAEELSRFVKLSEGMRGFDITDKLADISCPTMLIASDDDKLFGAEAAMQIREGMSDLCGFEYHMYSGCGHAVYDTAPDLKERMRRFLAADVPR